MDEKSAGDFWHAPAESVMTKKAVSECRGIDNAKTAMKKRGMKQSM